MKLSQKVKCFLLGVITPILLLVSLTAKAEVTWYGEINRGSLWTDDGHDKNTYFVDSGYSSTKTGLKAEDLKLSEEDCLSVGGNIEVEIHAASSNNVSQLDRNGSKDYSKDPIEDNKILLLDVAEVWLTSDVGKFSVGKGNTASHGSGVSILSGTDIILYSSVSDMAGGTFFRKKGTTVAIERTKNPRITDNFDPINGLGTCKERIRYDTPNFNGFSLAASISNEDEKRYGSDLALHYEKELDAYKLQGSVAFARYSKADKLRNGKAWSGSFAVLHKETGLNGSVALGRETHAGETSNPQNKHKKFYYVQLGKQCELIKYGKTNFAIDFFKARHSTQDHDKSRAFGFGVVQELKKIHSNLYLGVRYHKYDRVTQKYNKVIAALAGIQINLNGTLIK